MTLEWKQKNVESANAERPQGSKAMGSKIALARAIEAANHLTDEEPPWVEILESAKELVGADTGTLIVFDANGKLAQLTAVGFSHDCFADYDGHYHSCDVLEQGSRLAESGTWLDTTEMYSRAQLSRTEFFSDFMQKHRMAQILALVVEGGATISRGHRFSAVVN